MTTVTTKSELKRAIEQKQFPIKCVGEIASQLKRKKKRSKAAKIAGASMIVAGLAAMPFTGGTSAAGVAAGASAMGLTIGISAAELAILVGGGVAVTAVLKGRKVRLGANGSVVVE